MSANRAAAMLLGCDDAAVMQQRRFGGNNAAVQWCGGGAAWMWQRLAVLRPCGGAAAMQRFTARCCGVASPERPCHGAAWRGSTAESMSCECS